MAGGVSMAVDPASAAATGAEPALTPAPVAIAPGPAAATATAVTPDISTTSVTPVPLPRDLTITARGESSFTVAASTGEAPFIIAPAVVAEFAVTGPADMFTIGAGPGPFVVAGAEPTFTVTATADAPFTVEEV